MTLEEQIRNCRKQAGISQEKMAELIGVSRQAITKWENGTGTPDITNLVAIAELFQISLDELLMNEKREKKQSEYLYVSTTEYDIDGIKSYDIKLGSAYTVMICSSEGEKIKISLFSNIIKELQRDYKIKLDDVKNRIDVELQRLNGATETDAKESMVIQIDIPQKYIDRLEVAVNAKRLELMDVECKSIEFDGKVAEVCLKGCKSIVDINCNLDMSVEVMSHEGAIEINQISAISKVKVPMNFVFRAKKKGIGTAIYYEEHSERVEAFSLEDADNYIELNGMKSELYITREEA
ncbi:MAG: helix-turn-helix transcriptional regulator [Lachnospiraceae bacterium]|nr:helix-turn-helix transcriptional regulator [Lachnospiraceae bacterium]